MKQGWNMSDSFWYVYVLQCSDGSLYCGITTDVDRRFSEHQTGVGAKYTRAKLPVKLLVYWTEDNRSDATKVEIAFKKRTRKKKLQFIEQKRIEQQSASQS